MENNLLSESLVYSGDSEVSTRLHLYSYDMASVDETTGKAIEDIKSHIDNNKINWVKVCGLGDTEAIRSVCEHFDINLLVLQDILNVKHPTKIEEHEKHTVVILKRFYFDYENSQGELQQEQLCLILGENYVLTFQEDDTSFFDDIIHAIKHNTLKIRGKQSDYLLSVLLNNVMADYTQIVSSIDDSLEDLEEQLLKATDTDDIGVQIRSLRRQYLQVKKDVLPLKEQYVKLLRSDNVMVHKTNLIFFNDVNDHLQFVLQTIDICRETLASLVDLYISNNDLKMNNIMKQLTIVSTIFIPLTFLVGVWGMNFAEMPELSWRHGYLFAWILIFIVGLAGYIFFKRKKWK
jgi:magnesium transporter